MPSATSDDLPIRFLSAGDCHLVVELGDTIDAAVNQQVIALGAAIKAAAFPGVDGVTPTYRSLLIAYDPMRTRRVELEPRITSLAATLAPTADRTSQRWRVPVVYGGEHGIDLEELAAARRLNVDEVITQHSAATYRVFMIGFAPGYTYLGGLAKALHTPRRPTPRLFTPAGSIAIGGQQTCVASIALPTGWNLIGRTPLKAFDPAREPACLFQAGDEVAFEPISAQDFEGLTRGIAQGEITVERFLS